MKRNKLYIIFFSVILYSCTTVKPASLPDPVEIPEVASDSSFVEGTVFKAFIEDQYLRKLIDSVLARNFDLKQAYSSIQIAAADKFRLSSRRLPLLSAITGAGVEKFGKYTIDGVGNFDTNLSDNIDKNQRIPDPTGDFFLGFTSAWEMDIWGKLKDLKAAAHSRYLASEQGRRWLTTQLVTQVAEYYYALLSLDEQQRILEENIRLQKEALELMETQMLGGRATSLAVKQFEARLLQMHGAAIVVKNSIIETENRLRMLLGNFTGIIEREENFPDIALHEFAAKGIPSELLLRRPDIRQAELELKATKADVSAARKAFFPSISLSSAIGLHSFKLPLLINGSSLAAGAASSLTAPLLNRGELNADMKIANAVQEMAFYNYQNKILEAFHETNTLIKNLQNLQEAFTFKDRETTTLKEALNSANDLYLAGYANYLEVIIAQERVLQAELERIYLKEEMYKTIIGLFRTTGGENGI
jgi:multidrug efflux system outer membrane protein